MSPYQSLDKAEASDKSRHAYQHVGWRVRHECAPSVQLLTARATQRFRRPLPIRERCAQRFSATRVVPRAKTDASSFQARFWKLTGTISRTEMGTVVSA